MLYQLKVRDKLLEKNDGIWIWHVNHKESFVEVFDGKVFWKKKLKKTAPQKKGCFEKKGDYM